jgi:6-phosphogluconate dehydrogenase
VAPELIADVHQIAALWNHASVVRSWLLELAEVALGDPAKFSRVRGYVEDHGEGAWTVNESTERAVATPVMTASLYARFSSRAPDSYSARIVAALRNEFGGHKIFETIGHDEVPLGSATQAAGDAESVDTR